MYILEIVCTRKLYTKFMNAKLKEYIESELATGASEEDLRNTLKQQGGWSEEDLNGAFGQKQEHATSTIGAPDTNSKNLMVLTGFVVLFVFIVGGTFAYFNVHEPRVDEEFEAQNGTDILGNAEESLQKNIEVTVTSTPKILDEDIDMSREEVVKSATTPSETQESLGAEDTPLSVITTQPVFVSEIITSNTSVPSENVDTDGDGINDAEEVRLGYDPNNDEEAEALKIDISSCDSEQGTYSTMSIQGSLFGGFNYYDICLSQLADKMDNVFLCENIPSTNRVYGLCYAGFAYSRGAVNLCDTIPNDNTHKERCFRNAAAATGDLTICERILTTDGYDEKTREKHVEWCREGVFIEQNDPGVCKSIPDEKTKDKCYLYFALLSNDHTYCSDIQNDVGIAPWGVAGQADCYGQMCVRGNNFDSCLKSKDVAEDVANKFIGYFAAFNKDDSYCSYTTDTDKTKYFPDGICFSIVERVKSGALSCSIPAYPPLSIGDSSKIMFMPKTWFCSSK